MADNFGERAATAAEVEDFKDLVRAGKNAASRRYKPQPGKKDSLRPVYGSGRASSEDE